MRKRSEAGHRRTSPRFSASAAAPKWFTATIWWSAGNRTFPASAGLSRPDANVSLPSGERPAAIRAASVHGESIMLRSSVALAALLLAVVLAPAQAGEYFGGGRYGGWDLYGGRFLVATPTRLHEY